MAEVVVMPPAVGGEIQREGSDDSVVELCVRTLDKKEWTMMVPRRSTVEDLKRRVAEATSISMESQRLLASGNEMDNMRPLSDYCKTTRQVVYLVVRFPGASFAMPEDEGQLAELPETAGEESVMRSSRITLRGTVTIPLPERDVHRVVRRILQRGSRSPNLEELVPSMTCISSFGQRGYHPAPQRRPPHAYTSTTVTGHRRRRRRRAGVGQGGSSSWQPIHRMTPVDFSLSEPAWSDQIAFEEQVDEHCGYCEPGSLGYGNESEDAIGDMGAAGRVYDDGMGYVSQSSGYGAGGHLGTMFDQYGDEEGAYVGRGGYSHHDVGVDGPGDEYDDGDVMSTHVARREGGGDSGGAGRGENGWRIAGKRKHSEVFGEAYLEPRLTARCRSFAQDSGPEGCDDFYHDLPAAAGGGGLDDARGLHRDASSDYSRSSSAANSGPVWSSLGAAASLRSSSSSSSTRRGQTAHSAVPTSRVQATGQGVEMAHSILPRNSQGQQQQQQHPYHGGVGHSRGFHGAEASASAVAPSGAFSSIPHQPGSNGSNGSSYMSLTNTAGPGFTFTFSGVGTPRAYEHASGHVEGAEEEDEEEEEEEKEEEEGGGHAVVEERGVEWEGEAYVNPSSAASSFLPAVSNHSAQPIALVGQNGGDNSALVDVEVGVVSSGPALGLESPRGSGSQFSCERVADEEFEEALESLTLQNLARDQTGEDVLGAEQQGGCGVEDIDGVGTGQGVVEIDAEVAPERKVMKDVMHAEYRSEPALAAPSQGELMMASDVEISSTAVRIVPNASPATAAPRSARGGSKKSCCVVM